MEEKDIYPIGQQDFKTLREREALYVDKTYFIDKIVRSRTQYYFLARPRRFGKSLFLSTLKYFFEGRRSLFKDLYIDSTNWNWDSYPVLHIDLNTDKFAEPGILEDVLETMFRDWEKKYEVTDIMENYSQRFKTIIKKAHENTGKQVVILVDEYDKPLVSNLNRSTNFEHYLTRLAALYSNFKSSAEHIRLVFLTGVSRFGKLSVFSDLNNLADISFSNDFADICGITEQELINNFQDGIKNLAYEYKVDNETILQRLKQNYDGYRFAKKGSDIYNPWSILSAMKESRFGAFWNATGAASIVAEILRSTNVDIEKTLNARWKFDQLAGLDLRNTDPTALLYQTGYLTLANYNFNNDTVRLKVPNKEVKEGLFNDLLPFYVKVKRGSAESTVRELINNIEDGEPEEMMKNMQAYFSGIPYDLKMENENNFHNAIYILTTLLGVDTEAETHTSNGRIDLLIKTNSYIYIIELKYDSSAEEALRQIEEKGYGIQYANDGRKIFKIGVNFSSKLRRIENWIILV